MNNVTVNISGNTASLQAALSSATSQLATFSSHAAAAGSAASGLGAGASHAAGQVNHFNIVINNSTTVLSHFAGSTSAAGSTVGSFLGSFAALGGIQKFTNLLNESKEAVITAEKSFKGLESTAASVGVRIGDAMKVVKDLTKDGLVDNSSMSKSLQNLLAYGYTLKESEVILRRFKDTSAFGAQKGMSMSEALIAGTEGLKNENSALVDNTGITKNVAKMWEEFAGKQGLVAANLSDSDKRLAAYNGILEASNAKVGDAAKLAETFGGQIATAESKMTAMKETIGQAFTPAFEALHTAMAAAGDGMVSIIKTIQNLGAGASWTITKLVIFGSWFKDFDSTRVRKELDAANKSMSDFLKTQYSGNGAQFPADSNIKLGKPKADAEDTVKEKYTKEKAAYDIVIGEAKNARKIKENELNLELAKFNQSYEQKKITLEAYKKESLRINKEIANASETYFEKVASGLQNLLNLKYQPKEAELKVAISDNNTEKELAKIKNKKDDLKTSGFKSGGGGSGASSVDSIAKAEYEKTKAIRDLAFNEMQVLNNASISLVEYQYSRFKMSADKYYSSLNSYLISEYNQKQENTKKDIEGLETEKGKTKVAAEIIKLETEIKTLNSKLLTDETAFKQKYEENKRALEAYNEELKKTKALQAIDTVKADKDNNLSLRQVQTSIDRAMGNKVDVNEDKIIENAKFENTKESIEARRRYILENEKENTKELLSLDKELEEAQRNHILSIANLNANAYLQSKENYLSFVGTMQSSLAGAFVEINKHPKNFKEATLNALSSIHTKIMSMIAENWAKKLLNSDDVKNPLNSFMNMMGFGGMQKQPDLKDASVAGGGSNAAVTAMGTNLTTSITEKLGTVFDGVSSMFSNFFSGLGNALSSVFSSMSSSGGGGGGGGGGIMSFIGGLFSSAPALATGTNYVPQDNMLAFLHKGEAVIPAAFNNDKFRGGAGNMTVNNHFKTDQPQSRYSQSQQASLAVDALNRGTYNR